MKIDRLPLPLLIVAMTLPTVAAWLYFIAWAGQPAAAWIYGGTKVVMLALPLMAWWRWRPSVPTVAASRWWRNSGEGLLLGVLMGGGILLMAAGPLASVLAASTPRIAEKISEFGLTTPAIYLTATLVISLLHSAFEEWYWRWGVFGHLCARQSPSVAHAVAGLAFAGHHVVVAGVYAGPLTGLALGLVVGAAGVCWSLMYRRHGTLIGAWLAHACCDLALMWIGWQAMRAATV